MIRISTTNPTAVSEDKAFTKNALLCCHCKAYFQRREGDKLLTLTAIKPVDAGFEVHYQLVCPSCKKSSHTAQLVSKEAHTQSFDVLVTDKAGHTRKVPTTIPINFCPIICDWVMPPEAHEIIDKIKPKHAN